MSNFKSRILAYIVDMFIITIILTLLSSFIPERKNYENLLKEAENNAQLFVDMEIDMQTFINKEAEIQHDIDKENMMFNIMQAMVIIGYFIILPMCYNGKTIGKKLCKIKIVSDSDELSYNSLIIRSIFINGLGYLLLSMALVYILPSMAYFIATTIIGSIESILLIISLVMMIRREDHKTVHDLISGTKVIEG